MAPQQSQLAKLLEETEFTQLPNPGDLVSCKIVGITKNEIKVDIDGIYIGTIRGREIIDESRDGKDLQVGDEIEATVLEQENENGELELSLRFAGHKKAWDNLIKLKESGENIPVTVMDANRGGLIVKLGSVFGFMPVSQLLPEHYPRVEGGDKNKILDRLKSYVGQEFTTRVIDVDERESKLIVSEKQAQDEERLKLLEKYKEGDVVEGKVSAITDFGVFVEFDGNFEGLIHISELSWQRVNNPGDIVKPGDMIKTQIISIDGSKIFLSLKRLNKNPWEKVAETYTVGQVIEGKIIKVNPFGLFVQLDEDIQGLAHISEMKLKPEQTIDQVVKIGDVKKFKIISIDAEKHRLGLSTKTD